MEVPLLEDKKSKMNYSLEDIEQMRNQEFSDQPRKV